jgi:carnitine O-acetyltransferase
MLDGTPTLRLNEFMLGSIDKGAIPLELPEGEKSTEPMPAPEEIVFELDKHLQDVVAKSKKGFEDEMALQDLKVGPCGTRGSSFVECLTDDRWSTSPGTAKKSSRRTRLPLTLGLS